MFGTGYASRSSIDTSSISIVSLCANQFVARKKLNESDISQSGAKRVILPAVTHLELPLRFIVGAGYVPDEEFDDNDQVCIYVRRGVLRSFDSRNSIGVEWTEDHVSSLQKALCPAEGVDWSKIANHEMYQEYMAELDHNASNIVLSVVAIINKLRMTDANLNAVVQSIVVDEELDDRTIVGTGTVGALLTAKHVKDLSYDDALNLLSFIHLANEDIQATVDKATIIAFMKTPDYLALDLDGRNKALVNHMMYMDSTRDLIENISTILRHKDFEMPRDVARYLESPKFYANAEVYLCLTGSDWRKDGKEGEEEEDDEDDSVSGDDKTDAVKYFYIDMAVWAPQLKPRQPAKKGTGTPEGAKKEEARAARAREDFEALKRAKEAEGFTITHNASDVEKKPSGKPKPQINAAGVFTPKGTSSKDFKVSDRVFSRDMDPNLRKDMETGCGSKIYAYSKVTDDSREFLVYFAFALMQTYKVATAGATSQQIALYAVGRERILYQKLYEDGSEYKILNGLMVYDKEIYSNFTVDPDICELIGDQLDDPLEVDIHFIGSVICYLKSGHHISAAGFPVTVGKLLSSMSKNLNADLNYLTPLLPYTSYYAIHCASIRLAFAVLHEKSSRGDLSYAISRRLSVSSPGTTGFVVAMIYLQAMDRAKFFKTINRKTDFDLLVKEYDKWYAKNPLYAPYANYMYGKALTEDTRFKMKMSTYMAYCAALPTVMPTSSLRYSSALSRESSAAASNDIIGPIFASSYGSAIGMVASRSMRDVVDKQVLQIGV